MMHPALDLANPFQTSPAPSSAPHISPGESVPLQAYGAGEPAAVESSPAAAGPIPAGYVLVERGLLEGLRATIEQIRMERVMDEAFPRQGLDNPSWSFMR
jgi:hypothetical protein